MLHGQQRQDDADEGDRRADGEIEVARDDQHHGADRGEADDRGLEREKDEIALGEEGAVGGEIEEQPDRGEDKEQHRVAERRNPRQPDEQTPSLATSAKPEPAHPNASRSAIRRHPQEVLLGQLARRPVRRRGVHDS